VRPQPPAGPLAAVRVLGRPARQVFARSQALGKGGWPCCSAAATQWQRSGSGTADDQAGRAHHQNKRQRSLISGLSVAYVRCLFLSPCPRLSAGLVWDMCGVCS